ncbi:MAG: hypothetical protein ACC707_06970 [Thiohalomonadales bacterium]
MNAYIPVIIWLVSAAICYYIARKKNIKPKVLWNLTFALLGPIAIPIILLVKNKSVPFNSGDSKKSRI